MLGAKSFFNLSKFLNIFLKSSNKRARDVRITPKSLTRFTNPKDDLFSHLESTRQVMDPATAFFGIASGTVTLGALALQVGKTLKSIVNTHKQGAALVYSLIGACQAIEVAWNRISIWIGSQSSATYASDSPFYAQLATSIEVGKIVLGALQQDFGEDATPQPGQNSVRTTWKVLLNEDALRNHCAMLNIQLSSLHLLLATAKLSVLVDYLLRCLHFC